MRLGQVKRLAQDLCSGRVGVEQSVSCVMAAASRLPLAPSLWQPVGLWNTNRAGLRVLDAWPVGDMFSLLWALYL